MCSSNTRREVFLILIGSAVGPGMLALAAFLGLLSTPGNSCVNHRYESKGVCFVPEAPESTKVYASCPRLEKGSSGPRSILLPRISVLCFVSEAQESRLPAQAACFFRQVSILDWSMLS